jgi:hypothetical protein
VSADVLVVRGVIKVGGQWEIGFYFSVSWVTGDFFSTRSFQSSSFADHLHAAWHLNAT